MVTSAGSGWLPAGTDRPARSRALHIVQALSAFAALVAGGLAFLAWRAEPPLLPWFAGLAAGHALCAAALFFPVRWARRLAMLWQGAMVILWLGLCLAAAAVQASAGWLIVLGIGLTAGVLFHAWALVYLGMGRAANRRYARRIPDPAHWGPHWRRVPSAAALAHPMGRVRGALIAAVLGVGLSALLHALAAFTDGGWQLAASASFTAATVLAMALRSPLGWIFGMLWGGLTLLGGIAGMGQAALDPSLGWRGALLSFGWALGGAATMLYLARGERPNLAYRRRVRVFLPGEPL